MARVRQRGTAPELVVRHVASLFGLRYRVRNSDLPGSPDLANRSRKFAVFVHGCYWHRHAGCRQTTTPKMNVAFWKAKFARNVERDAVAARALREIGYEVVTVWECETRNQARVERVLSPLAARPRNIGTV
jgi:DNA mismatch endonuclease (patch repair protein)